jgi:hypothetical protein
VIGWAIFGGIAPLVFTVYLGFRQQLPDMHPLMLLSLTLIASLAGSGIAVVIDWQLDDGVDEDSGVDEGDRLGPGA